MILLHAIYTLWVIILLPLLNAEKFVPKVTEAPIEISFNLVSFDDSNTSIRLDGWGVVWISFDAGENWETVKEIEERIFRFTVDPFHGRERGFAFICESPKFYITDDRGESWRALTIPSSEEYLDGDCFITTHPTSKELLIANCYSYMINADVLYDPSEIYLSNDGESFFKIKPSLEKKKDDDITTSSCHFIKSSKDSDFTGNDTSILCLFSNREYDEEYRLTATYTQLAFSSDGGKTFKDFDEFKDKIVTQYKILKSYVVVLTQDDGNNEMSSTDIWISNDASTFQKAQLPTQLRHVKVIKIREDSIGRIILLISTEITNEENADPDLSEIFISDSQGLKFSSVEWTPNHQFGNFRLTFPDFLKGTIFGSFRPSIDYSNHQGNYTENIARGETKISVDNGLTWSNLKVVDEENADSFGCDITRPERCSLQGDFYNLKLSNPSAGIILMTGSVGDDNEFDWKDRKTFISRDGGLTWRVAHNSSGLYATGDLGNIIVYIPSPSYKDGDVQSKLYFSLDQGRTWNQYELADALFYIHPLKLINTTPDGSGSKFILSGHLITTASQEGNNTNISYIARSVLYAIDFSAAFDYKTCEEEDFEDWNLADGKCVNGAKYMYKRRKQDARCLVKRTFKDMILHEIPCDSCTESDYECSFEFVRDAKGDCIPDYDQIALSDICDKSNGETVSLEPLQLIKGDKCKKPMEIEAMNIPCEKILRESSNGKKTVTTENKFDFEIKFYQYFDTVLGESFIMLESIEDAYISHDMMNKQ
ncbi:CGH_1_collapsed_G0006330.mRNA.1.CDS.1 [Saccharomyces cerevisiae]|nr:CGH_3_collapsed_G0006290.mRNA.1.CDS.1 [Saccharomyces cerevisiae]CAI7174676.1 CGH_1_collapsed_G0006330.mRNA.1.CDS.1 [Saccharomyces cerevisiae]